jgi:hypothetical protein
VLDCGVQETFCSQISWRGVDLFSVIGWDETKVLYNKDDNKLILCAHLVPLTLDFWKSTLLFYVVYCTMWELGTRHARFGKRNHSFHYVDIPRDAGTVLHRFVAVLQMTCKNSK